MIFRFLIPVSLFFSLFAFASNDRVDIGEFSKGSLSGWENQKFVGETSYTLTEDNGQKVLHANSVGSASGLGRKIKIDLTKTPYVNWSWKIERRLPPLDERTKVGDETRGTGDGTGTWVTEKRNVREDFKKLFGKDITSIDAVAIMTDTDNSGLRARAAYGDIYFTAD